MLPDLSSLDADVRNRLKLLLEQQSTVCAGQLVIVGLDAIRDKLGDGWVRYRDRVHSHFDKVVESTLAPSEVTLRISDDKYVVVFHERDQAASQVVCEKILSQVHDTFLGSPELAGLSLDSIVMTLDPQSLARSMGLELENGSAPVGPPEAEKVPAAKPAPAVIRKKAGPFEVAKQDIWYLPVWDLENQLIYSYLPTIIRNKGRRRVAGYSALEDTRDPKQIRALDMHLMERGLRDLLEFHKSGGKSFVVLPVHYETLERSETRGQLHRLCMSVPANVRSQVMFLLTGLTPGHPPWRVFEYATMLSQLGRMTFAEIDARWDNLGRLQDLPIRGVSVRLDDDFRPPARIAKDLVRIQAFCAANRMFVSLNGVYSLDLATSARGIGAKFVSGHYVLGAVDKPQQALALDWMDIYHLMAGAESAGGLAEAR